MARALSDPSVEMGLWHRGSGEYRDSAGRTIELPGAGDRRVANRIDWGGGPVAVVVHDQALAGDPRLVRAIASALRLVAERAQMLGRLHGQMEEVRASRARIAEADDAARRRLERDLHDGAQQRLGTLSMTLASSLQQLADLPEASDLQATLALAGDELRQGLAELRELFSCTSARRFQGRPRPEIRAGPDAPGPGDLTDSQQVTGGTRPATRDGR